MYAISNSVSQSDVYAYRCCGVELINVHPDVTDLTKGFNSTKLHDSWSGFNKASRPIRSSEINGRPSPVVRLEDVPLEDEPLRNLFTSVVKGGLGAEASLLTKEPEHMPTVNIFFFQIFDLRLFLYDIGCRYWRWVFWP